MHANYMQMLCYLYIKDLSIHWCGFWRASWNQSPLIQRDEYNCIYICTHVYTNECIHLDINTYFEHLAYPLIRLCIFLLVHSIFMQYKCGRRSDWHWAVSLHHKKRAIWECNPWPHLFTPQLWPSKAKSQRQAECPHSLDTSSYAKPLLWEHSCRMKAQS